MVKKLRINEDFDPSVPNWAKKALSKAARDTHTRYGSKMSDLNKKVNLSTATFYSTATPVNARDPKWSNEVIVPVFHGIDVGDEEFTWIIGYNDPMVSVDPADPANIWNKRECSKISKKKLIDMCTDFGYFNLSDEQELKDIRQNRSDARSGGIFRGDGQYKDDYDNQWKISQPRRGSELMDKSGYLYDPKKYAKMFAELNITNALNIVKEASQKLTELSRMYVDLMNISEEDSYIYTQDNKNWLWNSSIHYEIPYEICQELTRDIMEYMKRLNTSYKNFTRSSETNPDEIDDSWYKNDVISSVNDMRNINKACEKFFNSVKKFV